MSKSKENLLGGLFISDEQKQKIERRARRDADIELGVKAYQEKVHKNKKAYSRKVKYKSELFSE
jgi:anti-sigma-K factor RskA